MKIQSSKVIPFLNFSGQAEAAMNFYLSIFPKSELLSIKKYGKSEVGKEGTVEVARFSLNEQVFLCIDEPIRKIAQFFSPPVSFYVNCETEEEIDLLYRKLSTEGTMWVPLEKYPRAQKYAWVTDRFGVSWQLRLPYPVLNPV
jgi:predicted 3-demethylubiquinone-9 3-methyltransferase (glyoxalase superfamily)